MLSRAWHRVEQFFCRHDPHWAYEVDRVLTRCSKCGHESPGWQVARANKR